MRLHLGQLGQPRESLLTVCSPAGLSTVMGLTRALPKGHSLQ